MQNSVPISPDTPEIPLIWLALGGLASACGGAFALLWSAVAGVRKEETVEHKQIWDRITTIGDKDADWREDHAKHAVTREDMAEFRDEIGEMIKSRLKLHEARVADIVRYEIDNRKPPSGP